jgi:excisionase family DNA binding protein
MRTDKPLLVSIIESSFQLSVPEEEIAALVRDGELVAVKVGGQVLIAYDSLAAFTRRAKRSKAVFELPQPAAEKPIAAYADVGRDV